jgi:hypothetical protein
MNILSKIKSFVEHETGINDISENKRTRNLVNARAIYCQIAFKLTHYTLDEIGRVVNYHHSTVLHSKKVFDTFDLYEPKCLEIYNKAICSLKNSQPEKFNTDDLFVEYMEEIKEIRLQAEGLKRKKETQQQKIKILQNQNYYLRKKILT